MLKMHKKGCWRLNKRYKRQDWNINKCGISNATWQSDLYSKYITEYSVEDSIPPPFGMDLEQSIKTKTISGQTGFKWTVHLKWATKSNCSINKWQSNYLTLTVKKEQFEMVNKNARSKVAQTHTHRSVNYINKMFIYVICGNNIELN